jgi:hypothetical protein
VAPATTGSEFGREGLELKFLEPSSAGTIYGRGPSLFRGHSLIFAPLPVFGFRLESASADSDANFLLDGRIGDRL